MRINGQKMSEEEFLSLLEEEYKGQITCVDKYINANTPIKFFCHEKDEDGNEHGEFKKVPYEILRRHRHCPICMGTVNIKPYGYWHSKTNCEEFAKTCKNKNELQKKSIGCYKESLKNGWLDEFQEKYFDGKTHYRSPEDPVHCVYVYLIDETHSCYVGRTSLLKRRHKQHKFGWRHKGGKFLTDNLYKHCEENNIEMPEPIILEENLTAHESQDREEYWLNWYINEGWNTLNKAVVGKNKGSLGATLKWTYEKCKEEASKYKNKEAFKKENQSAHNSARREGWINEFFPVNSKLPDGYWNVLENCQKEALKYRNFKELSLKGGGCYNVIRKNKWQKYIKFKCE